MNRGLVPYSSFSIERRQQYGPPDQRQGAMLVEETVRFV